MESRFRRKAQSFCFPNTVSSPLFLPTHIFITSIGYDNRTDKGYPLTIEPAEVLIEESPVDANLIKNLLPKLDYNVLVQAAQQLVAGVPSTAASKVPDLPTEPPTEEALDTEETLLKLHRVLMDIHLIDGHLICPDTGRRFPVKKGIPNMILHEDEV